MPSSLDLMLMLCTLLALVACRPARRSTGAATRAAD